MTEILKECVDVSNKTDPEIIRKCCEFKQPHEVTPERLDKELFSLLNSMGMVTCIKADGTLYLAEYLGLTDEMKEKLKHGSVGCEPMRIIAEKSIRTTEIITCMLNEFSTEVKAGGSIYQDINICSEGKMCCNLEIDQTGNIKVLLQKSVPPDVISAIGKQIRDDITEAFQEASKDMSSEEGKKFVEDLIKKIESNESITAQNKMNTSIISRSFTQQGICIRLKRGACISAGTCLLKQEAVIRILVQALVGSNLDEILGLPGIGNFFDDFVPDPKTPDEQIDEVFQNITKLVFGISVITTSIILGCVIIYWIVYRSKIKQTGVHTIGHAVGIIMLLSASITIGYVGWELTQTMNIHRSPQKGLYSNSESGIPPCCICRQIDGKPDPKCKENLQNMIKLRSSKSVKSMTPQIYQEIRNNLINTPLFENYNQSSYKMRNYKGGVCDECPEA
jgi:hypothetical protein